MAKGGTDLSRARLNKNDEFYTQYSDIEAEMNAYYEYDNTVFKDKTILLPCDDPEWSNFTKYFAANFNRFGLKKLISTSYAQDSKFSKTPIQLSLFEINSPDYDETKTNSHGKIFTLTRKNKKVNINNLKWKYLEGDGDFRSDEVKALRDEADIIITNPPFSMFRQFLAWIVEADKQMIIIGNQNAITYKEVFPLIMNNKLWLGESIHSGDRMFNVPDDYPLEAAGCGIDKNGHKFIRVKGVRWFTNIDHGGRHEPMQLMTMADNLKFNHKFIKYLSSNFDLIEYPKYNNYKNKDGSIDCKYSDAIPSDFDGIIGVPITFIDKYVPSQFSIVGSPDADILPDGWIGAEQDFIDLYYSQGGKGQYSKGNRLANFTHNGIAQIPYKRILIRHKKGGQEV